MNEKKVAFIICVNDDAEFEECKYYLSRLHVPEGYEIDVMAIREASSMTEGYNGGMKTTDAKYKVYLHQDVFIVHQNFIADMIAVFEADSRIGLLGCVGARHLGDYGRAVVDWDTGKILHNCVPAILEFEQEESGETYQEVEAVDGLLIATQYDLLWREDLFDGWDFYDISQCMEFRRAGMKVAVPVQQKPWCYHDNQYSKMTKYYQYCNILIREYSDIHSFREVAVSDRIVEYEELKGSIRQQMAILVEEEKRRELVEIFQQPENRGYLHLREFQVISDIEAIEEAENMSVRLWREGMNLLEVLDRVRNLKYMLKRLEYETEPAEHMMQAVCKEYSVFAVWTVWDQYIGYREQTGRKILSYYDRNEMEYEIAVWNRLCI